MKRIGGGGGRGEAEGARVPPAIIIDIDHISSIAGYTGSNILFEMPDLPALLLKLDFLECMPPRLTSIIWIRLAQFIHAQKYTAAILSTHLLQLTNVKQQDKNSGKKHFK